MMSNPNLEFWIFSRSKYTTFSDLRGHSFAYNGPDSLSGSLMVLAELKKLGYNASFFGNLMHSGTILMDYNYVCVEYKMVWKSHVHLPEYRFEEHICCLHNIWMTTIQVWPPKRVTIGQTHQPPDNVIPLSHSAQCKRHHNEVWL